MVSTRHTPTFKRAPPTSGWKADLRKALLNKRGGLKLKTKGELRAEATPTPGSPASGSPAHSAAYTIGSLRAGTYKRKRQLRLQITEHDDLHRAVIDMSPFAVSAINRASESFSLPKEYTQPPTPDVALKCLEFICAQVPRISPTASKSTTIQDSIDKREERLAKRQRNERSAKTCSCGACPSCLWQKQKQALSDGSFSIRRGCSDSGSDTDCSSEIDSESEHTEEMLSLELGVGMDTVMHANDIGQLEVMFNAKCDANGIDLRAMVEEGYGLLSNKINDELLD